MKNKITGWKDVYKFTVVQTLKSKTFLVSFIILLVLGCAMAPIMSLINGDSEQKNYVDGFYVMDSTGVLEQAQLEKAVKDTGWNVAVQMLASKDSDSDAKTADEYRAIIDETETNRIFLSITTETPEGSFGLVCPSMYFEYSKNGDVTSVEMENLMPVVREVYENCRYNSLGISEETQLFLKAVTEKVVTVADASGEAIVEEDTSISDSEYWLLYGLVFVVMMICTMTGSQVATSVVTEKSSKVVEYLLTSIKPLAIIIGKVLAMLCVVMLETVCLIVGIAVSNSLTSSGSGQNMFAKILSPEILSHLNVGNILLCLLLLALGLLFYATLAGLAGATVSKIEESSEALTTFTISIMIGAYMGMAAAIQLMASGESAYVVFAQLFPLSAPFLLPGSILIGKTSTWLIIVGLLILVAANVLLMAFVARVYENLIVYNGSRVKFKQLLKMR